MFAQIILSYSCLCISIIFKRSALLLSIIVGLYMYTKYGWFFNSRHKYASTTEICTCNFYQVMCVQYPLTFFHCLSPVVWYTCTCISCLSKKNQYASMVFVLQSGDASSFVVRFIILTGRPYDENQNVCLRCVCTLTSSNLTYCHSIASRRSLVVVGCGFLRLQLHSRKQPHSRVSHERSTNHPCYIVRLDLTCCVHDSCGACVGCVGLRTGKLWSISAKS
jgi:hypothetical protein